MRKSDGKRHLNEHDRMMRDLEGRLRAIPGIGPRAVLALAAFGADDRVIAAAAGVGVSDLSDLFSAELETGRTVAATNVINALWRNVAAGSTAAIRELDRRMGVTS